MSLLYNLTVYVIFIQCFSFSDFQVKLQIFEYLDVLPFVYNGIISSLLIKIDANLSNSDLNGKINKKGP